MLFKKLSRARSACVARKNKKIFTFFDDEMRPLTVANTNISNFQYES